LEGENKGPPILAADIEEALILDYQGFFPLTKLLDEVLVLLETVGFIQEGAHDLHHTATVYQGVYRPA
jgi:hypothetical protein